MDRGIRTNNYDLVSEMAHIDYITISITRTSTPAGHSCNVDYTYYLHTDKDEYEQNVSYSVGSVLCGHDLLYNKPLGKPPYDTHMITARDHMPMKRHFMVPCSILDEAWGKDRIYLELLLQSSHGDVLSAKSDLIEDHF